MKKLFSPLLAALVCVSSTGLYALPADLSAPPSSFGDADRDGTLLISKDLREADFGGGLRLPVRWIFQSLNQATSIYGWKGFTCPVLQSKMVRVREDLVEVTLLCGKRLFFTRQFIPPDPVAMIYGGIGLETFFNQKWTSTNGEWRGEDVDEETFIIRRWDGWKMEFKNGLIYRLTTEDDRILGWEYGSSEPRLAERVYEVSTNNTVIMVETSTDTVLGAPPRWTSTLTINGDAYTFTYANQALHEIVFPDGRKITWTFAAEGSNETKLTLRNESGYTGNWVYDNHLRLLRSDDVWAYAFAADFIAEGQRFSSRFGSGGGTPLGGGASFSFSEGAPAFTGGGPGSLPVTIYDNPLMQRIRIATGEKEKKEYSASNSIVSFTDVLGNVTQTYIYKGVNYMSEDSDGPTEGVSAVNKMYDKPYKIERKPAGATEFTTVWRGSYDSATGDLIRSYDADDNETTYAYERFSGASEFQPPKKVTKTDPLGRVRSMERDIAGDVIEIINPAGVVRKFVWDSRHRLTRIKNAASDDLARFTYGDKDQITEAYDALGNKTEFNYTVHLGRSILTKSTTPEGLVTEWTLDSKGRKASLERPSGATWTYGYLDDTIAVELVTDPATHTREYEYDARLNLTKLTDELGEETEFEYDDLDLPKEMIDALNQVTKSKRNAYGGLKEVTDARNNVYTIAWADSDQRKELAWPDGVKKEAGYTADGLVTSFKPRGADAVITNTWNEARELSGQSWTEGSASGSVSWTRNGDGQLTGTSTTSASLTVTQALGYDGEGRLATLGQTVGGVTRSASMTYDLNGAVKTITYPAGFTVEYLYNDDGQISSIKKGSTTIATYGYDSAGRLGTVVLSNGLTTTYSYDGTDHLAQIAVASSSETLWAERYGYNAAGERIHTLPGTSGTTGDAYSLDEEGQLKGVKYGAANANSGYAAATGPAKTSTWTYDAVGNRTNQTLDAVGTSYTANNVNQYTAVASATPVYSSRGDLVGLGDWEYAYDAYGNLTTAHNTATNKLARYWQDGSGHRAVKEIDGARSLLFNLGFSQLEAYNVTASTAMSTIFGPGIDGPLAEVDSSGNLTFYHQDCLGNVVLLTDNSGTVVEKYAYDVWGQVTAADISSTPVATGSIKSRWLFTGHEFDKETGLYHYRARAYLAELGRFLQNDPVGFGGGDVNLYRYVSNSPINLLDPFGLDQLTIQAKPRTFGDTGHVAVTTTDAAGKSKTNGFYPGGVQEDSEFLTANESKIVEKTYEVTEEQRKAAEKTIDEFKDDEWTLSHNCVDMAKETLGAIGVKTPDLTTEELGMKFTDPNKMCNFLKPPVNPSPKP